MELFYQEGGSGFVHGGSAHIVLTTLLIKKFDSDDVWRLPPELGALKVE